MKPLLLRSGVERCLHRSLGLIAVIGRSGVGIVEVLVLLLTGGIAAATTVATTLETAEAAATARHTTAAATNDAHHDTEKNETSDDHNGNDGPPEDMKLVEKGEIDAQIDVLAKAGCHAVVPAG